MRFDPDEIAFPGESQSGDLAECAIRRPAIRQALASVGARRVSRLLKWRRPHETTGFNRIGERIRLEDLSGLMVVELPPGADVEVAARRVALEGGIRYAHPSAILEPQGVPSDSLFGLQWYLHSTGQSVCGYTVAPNADINAPEAWDVWTGAGHPVQVGLIEAGVQHDHPDLAGRIAAAPTGIDLCDACGYGDPFAPTPHGTAVAGIMAATANNFVGIAGINWGLQVVSMTEVTEINLAANIDWARTHEVPILNASWAFNAGYLGNATADVLLDALRSGMMFVCAMSNADAVSVWPAAFSKRVLAVGALGANGYRWRSLDYPGQSTGQSNIGSYIDLSAPGGVWVSTTKNNSEYYRLAECAATDADYFCCTSAATPVVSGVASLVLSYRPKLLGEDIQHILGSSALDIVGRSFAAPQDSFCAVGWDSLTGHGMVRAREALDMLTGKAVFQTQGTALSSDAPVTVPDTIYNFPDGSLNGTHSARRFRLSRNVSFSGTFTSAPEVWTRGSGTAGTSSELSHDYNEEIPSASVVVGSVTTNGCTVETYVFEVLNAQGQTLGWYPCSIQDATIGVTALGPGTDVTAPSQTTDLAIEYVSNTEIHLRWTASGDDGMSGRAFAYDLRRASTAINSEAKFSSATPVITPAPLIGGSAQTLVVSNLTPCAWNYFALKTVDQIGWVSARSSTSPGAKTLCAPGYSATKDQNGPETELAASDNRAVTFLLPEDLQPGIARLELFDISGRRIACKEIPVVPGLNRIPSTVVLAGGAQLRSGIYFAQLAAAGRTSVRRVALVASLGVKP